MVKLSLYLLVNSILSININVYIIFKIMLEISNKVNYIYSKLEKYFLFLIFIRKKNQIRNIHYKIYQWT